MPGPEPTPAAAVRRALVVAADAYEDARLRALRSPARDAEELARVLGDPEVGAFDVSVSLNEPDHVVRRRISEFFRDRGREDLLLLHISGHGLKDEDGTLYFASSNTDVGLLDATAVPSEFVNRQMTRSRSRRIVLLLDCCFGGAFARGLVHRAGESVAISEEFEGQGRVVLTASRAMEYAFEGDQLEGDPQPSIFTAALVRGLESGEADRDADGRVSVDELYDYVYDRVRDATPNQTPSKWTFDVQGDLYVARSPRVPEPQPAELPLELLAAIESPFATVRAGAVEELARLLGGSHRGLAAASEVALEELAGDDSRRVSEAAASALGRQPEPVQAEPVPVAPAPPAPPRPAARRRSTASSRLAVTAARAAGWKQWLALAGAAALVLGYFRRAAYDSAWSGALERSQYIWQIWSPVEAIGLGLLVGGGVLAARRGRLRAEPLDGFCLGVGVVALAAALAVGGAFDARGTFWLTLLAALLLLAAGLLGIVTRRSPALPLERRTTVRAVTGTFLALTLLWLNFGDWPSGVLQFEWWPTEIELVVIALAAGAATAALVLRPRWRLALAGTLVALGAALALHVVGVLVQLGGDAGAGHLRLGGPVAIVAGLLLVSAGRTVLAGPREPAAKPAALNPV